MSIRYTESETIAAVARLTPSQLSRFVSAQIIRPLQTDAGPRYRQIDLARLQLLCELRDDFDLDFDALCMVITLVDRLHETRAQLRTVLEAVRAQPEDVHQSIAGALRQAMSAR